MDTLTSVLKWCFNLNWNVKGMSYTASNMEKVAFLTVNIDKEEFEVPVFMFYSFTNAVANKDVSSIVACLKYTGNQSRCSSASVSLKNTLQSCFTDKHLVKLGTFNSRTYYASLGTVFDSDFNPVMVLLWRVRRIVREDRVLYEIIKPVARFSSEIFVTKDDSLRKYIASKVVASLLSMKNVYNPFLNYNPRYFIKEGSKEMFPSVEVVFDYMPIAVSRPEAPSVRTTSKDILKAASLHLNNIV